MGGLDGRTPAQRLAKPGTSHARLAPLALALLTIALICCLFGPVAPADASPSHVPGQALQILPLFQQAELTPADGAASDMFGHSVALSGDTALVGAYGHATAGRADVGAVYIFTRSGTSWTQQAELTDPGGTAYDMFGSSVALSGDTALVAAPDETAGGLPGAAYVYVRSGTTWTQQAELTSAGPAYGFFGASVALDGDTALVGYGAQIESFAGEVSVFVRSGTTWTRQAEWMDPSSESGFGLSLALSGDTALVAAPGGFPGPGSAYVFMRSGTTWTQQAELTGASGFGQSVALSSDTALIGSYYLDAGGAGSAYVFMRSGATWTQQAELTAADGQAGDDFGFSVALDGDTALVASPGAGSAYVFMRSGTTWVQQAELTGVVGASVALSGDTAVVGDDGSELPSWQPGPGAACAFVVAPDLLAPTTAVSGVRPGWSKTPVTVTLSASDGVGGSGVTVTRYRLQGAQSWTTYWNPFQITAQGRSAYKYRSSDVAGNVEVTKTFTVKVDTRQPTTWAPYATHVVRGRTATLRYDVEDALPNGGTAAVTISVKTLLGKVVKTLRLGVKPVNKLLSAKFRCTLAKRTYKFFVYAKDTAGNSQSKVGSARLVVK